MNILTKLLVVLVLILSAVAVSLAVPFVFNLETKDELIKSAESKAASAEARLKAVQSQMDQMQTASKEERRALAQENTNLSATISTLETRVTDLMSQVTEEKNAKLEAQSDRDQYKNSLDLASRSLANLTGSIDDIRDENINLHRQVINSADVISDQEADLEKLGQQVRNMNEQLTVLSEFRESVEDKLESAPKFVRDWWLGATSRQPWEPPMFLAGNVTKVNTIDGRTIVEVNIGSRDRVGEMMKFRVRRGSEFLANLIIDKVDQDAAAGYLEVVKGDVQAGDIVETGPAE